MRELTDQEIIRREKAEKIREMGMDPFGNCFDRTAFNKEIKDKYKKTVGKRRVKIKSLDEFYNNDDQISKEIKYYINY